MRVVIALPPFFGVMHLSNTHFPYKIDEANAPFLPQDEATGPGYEQLFKREQPASPTGR